MCVCVRVHVGVGVSFEVASAACCIYEKNSPSPPLIPKYDAASSKPWTSNSRELTQEHPSARFVAESIDGITVRLRPSARFVYCNLRVPFIFLIYPLGFLIPCLL